METEDRIESVATGGVTHAATIAATAEPPEVYWLAAFTFRACHLGY